MAQKCLRSELLSNIILRAIRDASTFVVHPDLNYIPPRKLHSTVQIRGGLFLGDVV